MTTDAPTTTLTEWLRAQLDAEKERVDSIPEWCCTDSARGEGWGSRGDCPLCGRYMFDGTENATKDAFWEHMEEVHRRSHVLAQIAAVRAVVELHKSTGVAYLTDPVGGDVNEVAVCDTCLTDRSGFRDEWDGDPYPCPTIRALAQPYAGRAGWDEEWATEPTRGVTP